MWTNPVIGPGTGLVSMIDQDIMNIIGMVIQGPMTRILKAMIIKVIATGFATTRTIVIYDNQSSGGQNPRSNKHKSDKKSDESKKLTCYTCSGAHYSTDKKCPKYGQPKSSAKMYATREDSVKSADHKCQDGDRRVLSSHDLVHNNWPDPDPQVTERFAAACSDSEEEPTSEYGMVVSEAYFIGSQYISEGELYNMESDVD